MNETEFMKYLHIHEKARSKYKINIKVIQQTSNTPLDILIYEIPLRK